MYVKVPTALVFKVPVPVDVAPVAGEPATLLESVQDVSPGPPEASAQLKAVATVAPTG